MRTHLSWDGYLQRHHGVYQADGTYVGRGRLVNPKGHYDGCPYVGIYFVAGVGYQYKE